MTAALILIGTLGADFHMLAPPRQNTTYDMLAGPVALEAGVTPEQRSRRTNAVRRKRLLVYTAQWCSPCRRFRRVVVPKLRAAGWMIGTEPTNHLQFLDVTGGVPAGIVALPTFVLIEDGREVRRRTGYLDPWQIGEFFKGYSERPH